MLYVYVPLGEPWWGITLNTQTVILDKQNFQKKTLCMPKEYVHSLFCRSLKRIISSGQKSQKLRNHKLKWYVCFRYIPSFCFRGKALANGDLVCRAVREAHGLLLSFHETCIPRHRGSYYSISAIQNTDDKNRYQASGIPFETYTKKFGAISVISYWSGVLGRILLVLNES